MLGLYVHLGRERSKRMEFPKLAIAIGSDAQNDLVLCDGRVAPFHCRLVHAHDDWFLAPPGDGALEEPSPLENGAELVAGAYTIVLALPPRLDPVERSLIDQLVAGDDVSRLVYADWLESRGDGVRAEFLRLQQSLAGIDPLDLAVRTRFREEIRRLRELSAGLDAHWRRLVGRPAVEGCRKVTFDFQCRMDWGTLTPTARPDVRRCEGCGDEVHYVASTIEARHHARLGHCVAIDLAEDRAPGDLRDPPRSGYVA